MGLEHVVIPLEITSNAGAAVQGDWVKTGGHQLDIQFMLPVADLIGIEGSNDRMTGHPLTDADGADINGPTAAIAVDDFRTIREQPGWVRLICATDAAGAGRVHRAILNVHKPTS